MALTVVEAIKNDDESRFGDGANILEVIFHDRPLIHFSVGIFLFFLPRLGFCVKSVVLCELSLTLQEEGKAEEEKISPQRPQTTYECCSCRVWCLRTVFLVQSFFFRNIRRSLDIDRCLDIYESNVLQLLENYRVVNCSSTFSVSNDQVLLDT